jgi:hypothetical protein
LIVAFLVLFGLFVWWLRARPTLTPVIAVEAAAYDWPFPPNALAAEDLKALTSIMDKTVSLQRKPFTGRKDFGNSLTNVPTRFAQVVQQSGAVVVYVSAHGIVHDGTPYLVPPNSSRDVRDNWLSVEDFVRSTRDQFETIRNPSGSKSILAKLLDLVWPQSDGPAILIVLDCSRIQANWNLGLLNNDFSAAVNQWWNGYANRNELGKVAILCSAGAGERAWPAAELGGTAFGYFFSQGLAGKADTNNDNMVTLGELHQYLDTEVNGWEHAHRASVQRPILIPADAQFDLVEKSNVTPDYSRTAQSITIDRRNQLWRSLDKLRLRGLYRDEPLAWRDLEHKLLWLEELSASGVAYQQLALRTAESVQLQLQSIVERLGEFEQNPSVGRRSGIISGDYDTMPPLRLLSLPLAQYFGSLPSQEISAALDQLGTMQLAPSATQLGRAEKNLEQLEDGQLEELQFLRMLRRYESPEIWDNSRRLAQLMQLRARADRLGVPGGKPAATGDERAHYWVRATITSADDARRAAEDQLFVAGQPELDIRLKAADDDYKSSEQVQITVERASNLRDRAWAEWGNYAIWLADRPVSGPTANVGERIIQNHLVPLIEDARKLDTLLADHTSLQDSSAAGRQIGEIELAANRVAEHLDVLQQAYHEVCRRLTQVEESDAKVLREIMAVLAAPMAVASEREALSKQFEKIAKGKLGGDEAVGNQREIVTVSLFDLLDVDASAIGAADRNNQWREVLSRLGRELSNPEKAATRDRLSALDQKLRSVAPVWSFNEVGESDHEYAVPIRVLRLIDRQALVVWHAGRAIGDFWGPAGEGTPYFATAATVYLDSADELARSTDATELSPATSLREQIKRLQDAAKNLLTISAEEVVLIEPAEDVAAKVNISTTVSDRSIPEGTAAIILRHDGLPLDDVRFSPTDGIALPGTAQTVDVTIPGQQLLSAPAHIDAITMFRGHEFPSSILVDRLGGAVVDFVPHQYGPGRVTLHSPWKRLAVVLVLDCSQSMDELFEGDNSRLDVAKEALQELLGRLGSQRNVHVAVRMFGHRVGWSTDRPVRMLTSPTYASSIPSELTPETDVELVLPMQPFDHRAAQAIFAALGGVQHGWGQSPLYFSLHQALREDFLGEDAESDKHVIVITDGQDYQFRSTAGGGGQLSDVLQTWQQQRVPIHILELGTDNANQDGSTVEFHRLPEHTGGVSQNLHSSRDLQATLQSILAPDLYRLERSDGTVVDEGELGMSLIDAAQQVAGWYSVCIEDRRENVWLEGGEELELFVDSQVAGMRAFGYDHDVVAETWLRSEYANAATDRLFRVHRPVRDERNVYFAVSLQRSDPNTGPSNEPIWRWTRRPRETWVEITPLDSAGHPVGTPYSFYDPNFEPRKPVPVLLLVAHQWPADATGASVEAWFQPVDTAAAANVPMSKLVGDSISTEVPSKVVVDGVQVESTTRRIPGPNDIYRVRLVERRQKRANAESRLRLLYPPLGDTRPDRVVRQFDDRNALAVHWFDFADPDEARLARITSAEVAIAPGRAVRANAMHAEPVVVSLSEAGTLLPLTGQWTRSE